MRWFLFVAATISFLLSSPAFAAPDQSIRCVDMSVAENIASGFAAMRVEEVGPNRGNAYTFSFTTLDGSSIAGQDYTVTAGTRQVSPAQNLTIINIPINNDSEVEQPEYLGFRLTAGQGSRLYDGSCQIQITSEDTGPPPPQGVAISIAPVSAAEGATAAVNLVRTGDLSGYTSINVDEQDISAIAGADYVRTSPSMTFSPGESVKTVSIPINADGANEGDEMFKVFAYGQASGEGIVTIPANGGTPPPTSGGASEGDSISVFWGGTHPGMFASRNPAVGLVGYAVGGSGINDLVARKQAVINANPAYLTVLIGANDATGYATADDWINALVSYTDSIKAAVGAKVMVGTLLPQCNKATFNTRRDEINARIRARLGTKFDAIADFAAASEFDQASDACNTTVFQPDGVHPTDPTQVGGGADGQSRLLAVYEPAFLAMINGGSAEAPVGADGVQLVSIPSNFDTKALLQPAWGTGAIPPSASPDVVGAFRFVCMAGHISKDDPIVYPGQPGKAHHHQYFGNTLTNANSNYKSLRSSGESTCNNKNNRSAYWQPAMFNGKGMIVRPDYVTIYYKRRPASDPICQGFDKPQGQGICGPLPRGLRFIFGYNQVNPSKPPLGNFYYNCDGPGATQGHYKTIREAIPFCPAGSKLGAILQAPDCWDGKNLDSPDHQTHVANGSYGDWGYYRCPTTHPHVIPAFQQAAWYTVDVDLPTWRLSSDMEGMESGSTLHGDWFGGWDDPVMASWIANCINRKLNCSGGDLGNGQQITPIGLTYVANPRLVPIP